MHERVPRNSSAMKSSANTSMTGSTTEVNGKSTKRLVYGCPKKSLNKNVHSTYDVANQHNELTSFVTVITAWGAQYQSEYRGIVQYYLLAHNVHWFNKLHWVAETSLLKTLAGKHWSTVSKMAKKYKVTIETAHGPRKCLQVIVPRDNKKALVSQFGGLPLKRKQDAILVDRHPQFVMTNRSELLQRVLADKCELCGSKEKVEVHHIRKLADLEKPGRREKPVWIKQMAARRRKTLVVCRKCHEEIHAGTSPASFRRKGTGEPRDAKVSRVVREAGNGERP
jgi:hypothetical protein